MSDELEQAKRSAAGWQETAARHCANEEYYRGLVQGIGEGFGVAAKTSDDGSIQQDVLCAKVPELVEKLRAEVTELRQRNADQQYTLSTNAAVMAAILGERRNLRAMAADCARDIERDYPAWARDWREALTPPAAASQASAPGQPSAATPTVVTEVVEGKAPLRVGDMVVIADQPERGESFALAKPTQLPESDEVETSFEPVKDPEPTQPPEAAQCTWPAYACNGLKAQLAAVQKEPRPWFCWATEYPDEGYTPFDAATPEDALAKARELLSADESDPPLEVSIRRVTAEDVDALQDEERMTPELRAAQKRIEELEEGRFDLTMCHEGLKEQLAAERTAREKAEARVEELETTVAECGAAPECIRWRNAATLAEGRAEKAERELGAQLISTQRWAEQSDKFEAERDAAIRERNEWQTLAAQAKEQLWERHAELMTAREELEAANKRGRRDWSDPYMLEARPNHRATEAEQEDFAEAMEELGMIAAHLGANLDVQVKFRVPRKAPKKAHAKGEKPQVVVRASDVPIPRDPCDHDWDDNGVCRLCHLELEP